MFPLGTVMLPGLVMPLRVFEPRYRRLLADVGSGGSFGICLIERGHEVGGGDERSDVGTRVRVERAAEAPDGTWQILVLGEERIGVERWLADDPYPRAEIAVLPDPAPGPEETALIEPLRVRVEALRDRVAQSSGRPSPGSVSLDPDPRIASHQLAGSTPLGPLDLQRLLRADTVGIRLSLLEVLIEDLERDLTGRG